ncbi:FAD/NAD-binding domain-containing protein [Fomitiporia mediterranea MF3/22]|uniref:FAD/NAD-binding domain-containing protein n=1 Tax=Fomitiporia mediterranea (strain MF3/22) TaxID=694068 RepID=UPI0004407995|nr:FAD/NAD-binding domain-containing protein [Fomitiporia mediterranea MF3/22]EJD02743.1 FAD/NAD-binding domain-containing protein [Fomitiporia mediterranea MF3/22]
MPSTRVAIIGAGIAGPVLAMLLKQKGYDPVLYERTENITSTGLSLALQTNGLKVLRLIPGLIDILPGQRITHSAVLSTVSNRTIVLNDFPSRAPAHFGLGMRGVQREEFHRTLVEQAVTRGIPIHWGYQLESLKELSGEGESDANVELHFANGETAQASFVVGCDGLHSNTRSALFGEMKPDYTGNVQTGGMSPRPQEFKDINTVCNYIGKNAHIVAYPIMENYFSWAITQPEEERKESWRSIDEEQKEAFKNGPFSQLSLGAGEMVKTTTKVVKYGLYDRPELKTWYKGRVVLLGDAAHPTTPHLGQGANQAFEDVYHLVRSLTIHHPSASTPPGIEQLISAFAEYERVRLSRSSDLVRKARARGAQRVTNINTNDSDAVERWEEAWKIMWSEENMMKDADDYSKQPYERESEM